jgi:hypothetical protein
MAQVVRHLALRRKTRESLREAREREAARTEASPADDMERQLEVHQRVAECVRHLAEPYRTVIFLRYYEDLSPTDIAARLRTPIATVKTRLRRGLEALRTALDRESPGGRTYWSLALMPSALKIAPASAAANTATLGGRFIEGLAMSLKIKAAAALVIVVGASLWVWKPWQTQHDRRTDELGAALSTTPIDQRGPVATAGETPHSISSPDARRTAAGGAQAPARIVVSGRIMNLHYPDVADQDAPATALAIHAGLGTSDIFARALVKLDGVTDSDGAFQLTFDEPGKRPLKGSITADADAQYRPGWLALDLPEGTSRIDNVVVTRAAHGVLEGETVEDMTGKPLANVRVTLATAGPASSDLRTVTDSSGHFRMGPVLHWCQPQVERAGYTLFEQPEPMPVETGGWQPIRIVLAPAGSLLVHVVDAAGVPVPDVEVAVDYSPDEPRATIDRFHSGMKRSVSTDAAGIAQVADLWIGRRLVLTLKTTQRTRTARFMSNGHLLFADTRAEDAAAIRVPTDGRLELTAQLEKELTVRGRVVYSDHRPAPEADLQVRDAGAVESRKDPVEIHAVSDERGQFEIRVPAREHGGPLQFVAVDRHEPRHELGGNEPAPEYAAAAVIDPAHYTDTELLLVIEPLGSISGRVLNEHGAPVRDMTRVRAVPAGSIDLRAETRLGRDAWTETQGGAFVIDGLPVGRYDLYVSQQLDKLPGGLFYGFTVARHRFPDIEVGSKGLDLVIDDKRNVRIRISVDAGAGTVKELRVMHGSFTPRASRDKKAATFANVTQVDSLTDWPEAAPQGLGGGVSGASDGDGYSDCGFYETRETKNHETPSMQEGWLAIGVMAVDGNDKPYFPISTGFAYFAAGDYNITFKLVPTATVEGRVKSATSSRPLSVALVDHGKPLLLRTNENAMSASRTVPVRVDGWFRLLHAPVGTYDLRIGDDAQLGRGEFERQVPIAIRDGPILNIEIPMDKQDR